MSDPIGVYVHVPFCAGKCPYCDFYSLAADEPTKEAYVAAILRDVKPYAGSVAADTLYFGGGTPSLLGAERIGRLTRELKAAFSVPDDGEITMEANPGDDLEAVFSAFKAAGGNRASIGVQAADDTTLRALGRRHTVAQAKGAVATAHACGIKNVSVDLMLGVEGQTPETVKTAVKTVASWGVFHVSCYLLKIEPGTPFATRSLNLPDEDAAADLYLAAVRALKEAGFAQYEISNFARPGYESRHNLKYWNAAEYLGFGPAAHSYFLGKRTYFGRDLPAFLAGTLSSQDEETGDTAFPAGSREEYALLRLRLAEGLTERLFREKFGETIPALWRKNAEKLPRRLITVDEDGLRLSPEGFLVSNGIFTAIL
ncbi:MAG: radical SAM family heme chaperone HemW [Clostridia bacterium]|nr:radical SAM family heme chaperone HemW [Clostridia bacterium]